MRKKALAPAIRFAGFTDAWEQRKLGDAFDMTISNNTLSRAKLNYDTGEVQSIHYGDVLIKYGACIDVQNDEIPYITSGTLEEYKVCLLQKGDIIFADTAEDETTGKAAEIGDLQGKAVVSGLHTIVCRPIEKMAKYYLGYYLNSDSFHNQLLPLMQGIKVLSLSRSNLAKTIIKYPRSKAEQAQIGSLFHSLDHLITLQQHKYSQLCNIKKSMLERMFPKEGASVPEIRFAGFTDAWEQRKLEELGTITTGSTPSTSVSDYYSDDGIVWVTPTDISENITFDSARKLSKLGQQVGRVVPENTILVTCIASIGKNTMLGKVGSFNQQINGLTPNENKYDPYFLLSESSLWSAQMKNSAAAGTIQIVNRTEFSELKTWLPTLTEQRKIGAFFRHLDHLITLHQRKLERLQNIKTACLEKMFV